MLTSVQTKTPAQAGVFCVRTHSTTAALICFAQVLSLPRVAIPESSHVIFGIHSDWVSSDAGNHVEEDREVVSNAAGEYKQMPRCVEVRDAIHREEDDSQRISRASGTKPQQALWTDGMNQGACSKDNDPSLEKVDDRGGRREPSDREALEYDAGDGERPDDRK